MTVFLSIPEKEHCVLQSLHRSFGFTTRRSRVEEEAEAEEQQKAISSERILAIGKILVDMRREQGRTKKVK